MTYTAAPTYSPTTYTMPAQTYTATAPAQPTISTQPATTYTLPSATSMVAYPQYTFQSGAYAQPIAPAGYSPQQVGSALDANGDGTISQAELKQADANHDGQVDASEVKAAASKKKLSK